MNKPGMAKYLGFRGPHPGDAEAHLKFWNEDLERNDRMLAEAKAEGDMRVIKLAKSQRREIVAELARHGQMH